MTDLPGPTAFVPGQVVTVFRSRLRPDADAHGYAADAAALDDLARRQPGLVDLCAFAATDGERVTIATFADHASYDAWRRHPEHVAAQRRGARLYYATYDVQTAVVERTVRGPAGDVRQA